MPAPIQPQPIPSTGNVSASVVAVAASVQLSRVGQATRSGSGQTGATRIVTSASFITSTDTWVGADTTAAGFTLTLPLASAYRAMYVYVERYAGANTLTIAPQGSDTIDGSSTLTVTKTTRLFPIQPGLWHALVIQN